MPTLDYITRCFKALLFFVYDLYDDYENDLTIYDTYEELYTVNSECIHKSIYLK